jgi:hypothetical protein
VTYCNCPQFGVQPDYGVGNVIFDIHFSELYNTDDANNHKSSGCSQRHSIEASCKQLEPFLPATSRHSMSTVRPTTTNRTVPQPGPARLKRNAGPDEWLEAAKDCKYLSEHHMKQLCEIVKEYMMEGKERLLSLLF